MAHTCHRVCLWAYRRGGAGPRRGYGCNCNRRGGSLGGGGGIRWPRRSRTDRFPHAVDRALGARTMVGWIGAHPKLGRVANNLQHVASPRPVRLRRLRCARVSYAQESGCSLTNSDLVNGVPTSIFAASRGDLLEAVLHGQRCYQPLLSLAYGCTFVSQGHF